MRPPESFVAQPIRSLQTMLRVIAEHDDRQPSVVPDGIYGRDTIRAVTAFQRRNGLPPTGVTDQQTWEAVVVAYDLAIMNVGEALPINAIWNANQTVHRGESNPNIYLVQAMLTVLSQAYRSIAPPAMTGIMDIPTVEALTDFQVLCRLPMTGELDRVTWTHLAAQYPLAYLLITVPPEARRKVLQQNERTGL